MLTPPGATEAPDVETSSADYTRRFSGVAGAYVLDVQTASVERALAGLTPGTALDVGGGHGQLVVPLQRMGWSVTVHGTDDVCRRNLREVHGRLDCAFVRGSFLALPAGDQSFDLVISVRLLSHVAEWQRLLAEMCRVARRTVLVDYPSTRALNVLTPLLFGAKRALEGSTRPYRSFSRAELAATLGRNGYSVTREIKQFTLPIALHRAAAGSGVLRATERALRACGVTALVGSPAILRADRLAASGSPTVSPI